MRLLNTHTGHFVEKGPKDTEYAILSHTWSQEGEQTYYELREIQDRYPAPSHRSLPSHHHERRLIPPSPFVEPLDGSSALSSIIQPSANIVAGSGLRPNERTPLLPIVDSHDLMERGLPPVNYRKVSRSMQLQRLIVHSFQCVWKFLACFLLCRRSPRRPVDPGTDDHNVDSSPTLSALACAHADLDVHAFPHPPCRSRSSSEHLASSPESERSPEGNGEAFLSSLWDDPELSPKVRNACAVARAHGFRFIWIDASCIDRSNGSELSEAINSMYSWYASAAVCYAYLVDVPAGDDHRAQGSCFRESRWFARGWTLPELLAPENVTFLSQDWQVIGSKSGLVDLVEEVTGISREAFLNLKSLDEFSVAQRLSWASRRETTLVEDEAYSLLGIFGIDMPILYGEGERAFRRLQEEIMLHVPDHSIFALSATPTPAAKQESVVCRKYDDSDYRSLFATSPAMVEDSARSIGTASREVLHRLELSHPEAFKRVLSPHGIRTQLQMIPLSHYFPSRSIRYESQDMAHWQWYLAILACECEDHPGSLLGRVCYIPPADKPGIDFLLPGYVYISLRPERGEGSPDLVLLSPEAIERCRAHIETKTVYI